MLFITHLISGFLIYVLLVTFFPFASTFLNFCSFMLGVVAPDVDTEHSKVGKRVIISKLIRIFFGHRGAIHSFLGAVLLSLILIFVLRFVNLPDSLAIWFFIGYLSHLLTDSLTPQGIRWFYPFSKKKFRFFIRTGSTLETLFSFAVVGLLVLIGWNLIK